MPTTDHDHHLLDLDIPIFVINNHYNDRQIAEILYSLEGKSEVPGKYMYFDKGTDNWAIKSITDKETVFGNKKDKYSMFNGGQYEMINSSIDSVIGFLSSYNKVNLIDIGCGTGYSVFPVLSELNDKKQLANYIAIDISKNMLDLAVSNLEKDLPFKLKSKKYVHDFEDGHFADILIEDRKNKVGNLFCFFGSTLSDMADRHRALANIRDSMTEGDLLWINTVLYDSANYLVDTYAQLEVNSEEYMTRHKSLMSFMESINMTNWMDFGRVIVEKDDDFGLIKYNFYVEKPFIIQVPKLHNTKGITNIKYSIGEKITFNRLKNYPEKDLIRELREAGLKPEMINISKDSRSALVLTTVC